MAHRSLPPNLVSLFTQALKSYQLSNATFCVLCSLTSSTAFPTPGAVQHPPSLSPSPLTPLPPQTPPQTLLVLDSSFNPPTLAHQRMALSALSDESSAHGSSSNNQKSRLLLLLAINNADKAPKPAAFSQRLAMMYIFAQDLLALSASPRPLLHPAAATTTCELVDIAVTTEPYFHAKSAAVAAAPFYRGQQQQQQQHLDATTTPAAAAAEEQPMTQVYLTGFDTLVRIFDPKYYTSESMAACLDPFFSRARLRVVSRTGGDWGGGAEQEAYVAGLGHGDGLQRVGGREAWARRVELVPGRGEGEPVVSSTRVREAVRRRDWGELRELVSEGVAEWIREQGLYQDGEGKGGGC
ncbi:hypothetical protein AAE478_006125 [Parahypoxylon ruwenzoriense]